MFFYTIYFPLYVLSPHRPCHTHTNTCEAPEKVEMNRKKKNSEGRTKKPDQRQP